jgi:threonine dehydratase
MGLEMVEQVAQLLRAQPLSTSDTEASDTEPLNTESTRRQQQQPHHQQAQQQQAQQQQAQQQQQAEQQQQDGCLDAVLVPVSGGGMAAGLAIAFKTLSPRTRVIAVEPAGKQLGQSLAAGRALWPAGLPPLSTIADGCRTQAMGELTFPICNELLDRTVLSVTDEQVVLAMRLLFDEAKMVVEPSGAMALAAAIHSAQRLGLRRVGVIVCGGNVDLQQPLPWAARG